MEPDPLEPTTEAWRAVEAHARADQIIREFELSQADFERAMQLYDRSLRGYDIAAALDERERLIARTQSERMSRREELIHHLRNGWNYDRVVHDQVNMRAMPFSETLESDRTMTVERVIPSPQDEYDAVEIIRDLIADSSIMDRDEPWCRRYWDYNIDRDAYMIRVGDTRAAIPRGNISRPLDRATVAERNQEMAFVKAMEPEKKLNEDSLHYCSCWAEDKQFPQIKQAGVLRQCLKCGGQMNGRERNGEGTASGWINQSAAKRLGLPLQDVMYPTRKHQMDPETTLQWVRVEMEHMNNPIPERPF